MARGHDDAGDAPMVTLRRRFVDLPWGQVHLREGGAGGVPLLAIHQASGSAKVLSPLLRVWSETRHTMGPDLPGNGDSDLLPGGPPSMADYARAIGEALDALGVTQADVYGFHAGASVALELAIARPGLVRRVVLDSLSLYTPGARDEMLRRYLPGIVRHPHGLHLAQAWHYVRDTYLFWPWFEQDAAHRRAVDLPPLGALHDKVLEVLKGLDGYEFLYAAAFAHDKAARLPLLATRALFVTSDGNSQREALDRVAALAGGAETRLVAGHYRPEGQAETARTIAAWLDAP
jgi:pimeloyl-ACP methyl ester carboxylesterase